MIVRTTEAQIKGYVIRLENILIGFEMRFVLLPAPVARAVILDGIEGTHTGQLGVKIAFKSLCTHIVIFLTTEGHSAGQRTADRRSKWGIATQFVGRSLSTRSMSTFLSATTR
ncbi:hypothetical protein [Pseudomonas sp. C32]|uniref:hypothetical protein n=1 Tax=Pseudomonas sp. C32 TaxID=1529208 RepID=UPI0026059850|nr:hypothetical protein [Pseudomonas sp. C32]MDN4544665.1 hypothetical protein [Pseudomonas sp. C32]